jgi:molecular chaperone GrpE (heat shock protein)
MPALDMLVRAQDHLNDPGLTQVIREFKEALREEGIVNIAVKEGDRFDENSQEATDVEPTKDKKLDQTVGEVVQEGWKIEDGPVIRPAKVKVYRKE